MTAPTTSIRAAYKAELKALLVAEPATSGVQIEVGMPPYPKVQKRHIIVAKTTGNIQIPVFQAGRKQRDDMFMLTVAFSSTRQGKTMEEAEADVSSFFAPFENIYADDPTLDIEGVLRAEIQQVEGPNSAITGEGAQAWIVAEVLVHARYV